MKKINYIIIILLIISVLLIYLSYESENKNYKNIQNIQNIQNIPEKNNQLISSNTITLINNSKNVTINYKEIKFYNKESEFKLKKIRTD